MINDIKAVINCGTSTDCPQTVPSCGGDNGVNVCGSCTDNSQCYLRGPEFPICDISYADNANTGSSGGCGPCTDSLGCTSLGLLTCDTESGTCVECLTDDDCDQVCDAETQTCRACISNSECGDDSPICDSLNTGQCLPCATNTDCANINPFLPICVTSGSCVACTSDSQCTFTSQPICLNTGACVECLLDTQCSTVTGTPICDASTNKCRKCASNNDCIGSATTPVCDNLVSGNCVPCLVNTDCGSKSSTPICLANTCSQCQTNSQCQSSYGIHSRCKNGFCKKRRNSREAAL